MTIGAHTQDHSGTLEIGDGAGDTTTFIGGVVATAPSGITLGGTINTTDTAMTLGDAGTGITLQAATTLDTGNAGAGLMQISSVAGAGNTLTLDSGSTAGATITVTGTVDNVATLTVRDAGGLVDFQDTIGAGTDGDITITDSQAGVEFSASPIPSGRRTNILSIPSIMAHLRGQGLVSSWRSADPSRHYAS